MSQALAHMMVPTRNDGAGPNPSSPEEVGKRIEQARKENGMNQQEVADYLGMSVRSIHAYEAGEVIPYRNMKRIEQLFNRPVAWFLHGQEGIEAPVDDRFDQIFDRLGKLERQNAEILKLLRSK